MNNQGRGGRGGRKGRGGGRGAHGASNRTNVAARSSQTAVNSDTNSSGYDSQRTTDLSSGATDGSCQQRGRKRKSRTELKMPPHAGRIVLEPMLDTQFKYSAYQPKKAYTYTAQLGVILKKEYPGLVEDKDDNGEVVSIRAASCWDDYYLCPDNEGVCHADRVKREFWHLFEVKDEHKVSANVVLEKYVVGRVKDMMYSARVDAVKEYYRKQGEIIDESLARPRVLDYEKYMEGRVWWCMEDAWKLICRWWCSDEFKIKREIGQAARSGPEDVAQNRGGSRPFTEFQQYLEHTYGPEKASDLKTYQVMKTGLKNIDLATGTSGPITSKKVQKRIDDYSTAASVEHPDDWEQRPFDPAVLYQINGGLPHGRLPMGNGIVSKSVVQAAAKSKSIRPSNSSSYRAIFRENQELRLYQKTILSENQELLRNQELHRQVILTLLEKSNLPTPPELLQVRAHAQQAMDDGTDSSHVSRLSKNNADGDPDSTDDGGNNEHNGRKNGGGSNKHNGGQNQDPADGGGNNDHNGDQNQEPAEGELVPVVPVPSTQL